MSDERIKRVESLIQKEISRLILHQELKDPRINSMITVNRVQVSKDIAYAKVYISSFQPENVNKKAEQALNSASGFIQRQIGRHLKTRQTPKLTFIYDRSLEEGFRINKLIEDSLS